MRSRPSSRFPDLAHIQPVQEGHRSMARRFDIRKGLNLPLDGAPAQTIEEGVAPKTVALLADDYVGMKPTMQVAEGDRVRLGDPLFSDRKSPAVCFTSPGCGRVAAIHRGAKRRFQSIVIELDGDEEATFGDFAGDNLALLEGGRVRENLLASGLWTALRTRPYSKVPNPETVPYALFVTAMDTNPLAADPAVVLRGKETAFVAGLEVLSRLTDGPTYLCVAPGAEIPGRDARCVETVEFAGPHPAGLPGTHIHFLAPVSEARESWYVNYQDVAAIGHLFLTGRLAVDRVISMAGPAARRPRLVRTRIGASLPDITAGQIKEMDEDRPVGEVRVVSGSVYAGRRMQPPMDYLGRYHLQVVLLEEGRRRRLLGWMLPGSDQYSVTRAFTSTLSTGRLFDLTTSTGGSPRAIVPIGVYEKVMPLDIVATPLLKALVTDDREYARALGCLELDEEDLGLCTFVCPGKHNYGPILRRNLTRIEIEG